MSHILEEGQKSLEQVLYWKIFLGIIRKTCELAQYVNMHESFQNSPPRKLGGLNGRKCVKYSPLSETELHCEMLLCITGGRKA